MANLVAIVLYKYDEENIFSFYGEIGADRQINIIAPGSLVNGIAEVTARIYTQYGPLEEVRYQIDQGNIIPMEIRKEKLWNTATAMWDSTQEKAGYHTLMVQARDKEGVFSKQMEVKVCKDEILALGEIIPHFQAYQGHLIKVKGRIKTLLIEESYISEGSTFTNGALIVKDETGSGVILIGEYNSRYLPNLERGQIITAKVVPVKYLWKSIERKHKIYITLYSFRLPRGFIIREGFKPKSVHFLWLIDCENVTKGGSLPHIK